MTKSTKKEFHDGESMWLLALWACGDKIEDTGADSNQVEDTGTDTTTVDDAFAWSGLDFELIDAEGYTLVGDAMYLGFGAQSNELSFSAGCNSFGASYSMTENILNVSEMSGTEMGCDNALMEQDQWLANFLSSGPTLLFETPTLTLSNDGVVLTFQDRTVQNPAQSLDAGKWIIDTIFNDETASSLMLNVEPYVQFGNDGSLDLFTACNSGMGTYTEIETGVLDISVEAYSDAWCGDENSQTMESQMVFLFLDLVEYSIDGSRITLMSQDGTQGIGGYLE